MQASVGLSHAPRPDDRRAWKSRAARSRQHPARVTIAFDVRPQCGHVGVLPARSAPRNVAPPDHIGTPPARWTHLHRLAPRDQCQESCPRHQRTSNAGHGAAVSGVLPTRSIRPQRPAPRDQAPTSSILRAPNVPRSAVISGSLICAPPRTPVIAPVPPRSNERLPERLTQPPRPATVATPCAHDRGTHAARSTDAPRADG